MRTARALADQLRRRREALGLTLQEVSRQAAELDEPVPVSTLSRIERGALDPGVRRLHVLLRIYRIDPVIAADLAELERRADESPAASADIATLRAEAQSYWKEGNVGQTLSRIFAILLWTERHPDERKDRQHALQFSAVVARQLGRIRLAKRIVDELLCQPLDRPLLADVLVLAAALWARSGSREVAIALLSRASEVIDPADHRRGAMVRHQRSKLEMELGNLERAERLLEEALALYRVCGDTLNESRARLLGVTLRRKLGRADTLPWAREVVAFAEANDHGLVKASAYIELGRGLLDAGRPEEAAEEIRRGLASAVVLEAPNAEYHAHALLAEVHERMGDLPRARAERERAKALWRWAEEESAD
jgi:tetratricopeptide (TPR) repeat protein